MDKFQAIRDVIKELSAQQQNVKPQRKETYTGTRTIENYKAIEIAKNNKFELRHLYQAYSILRGKEPQEVKKSGKEIYKNYVAKLVEKYTPDLELA